MKATYEDYVKEKVYLRISKYAVRDNLRTAFDFVINYKLGELIGFRQSGFCTYPLIEFNLDEVKKYDKG